MTQMKRNAIGFMGAAVVASTLVAGTADAVTNHAYEYNAIKCMSVNGQQFPPFDGLAQIYNNTSGNMSAICPIEWDMNVTPLSANAIWVYGWANSTGATFSLCATYWDSHGAGGTCGSSTTTGKFTVFDESIADQSAWSSNADFHYLKVNLAPVDNYGSYDTLFGYQAIGTTP